MAKPNNKEKKFHLEIMSQGCCVCGMSAIFHHVSKKPIHGTLQKVGPRRDHSWGAALCDKHHTEYHNVLGSVDVFNERHGIDLDVEAAENYANCWENQ